MKIKHLFEDDKNYQMIIDSPFFKKHVMPSINKAMADGAEFFTLKSKSDNSLRHERSLLFTLSTDVFKHTNNVLLHGSKAGGYKTGEVYNVTHRAGPRDSNETLHNVANELAEDKFGEFIRNLLYLTRSMAVASDYANNYRDIYVVIPLDEPTFYYSEKYEDFFVDFLNSGHTTHSLLSEVNNTLKLLISDNEDAIKNIGGEEKVKDAWTLFKIAENSFQKFILHKSKSIFNALTHKDSLNKLVSDIKIEISDYILYVSEKNGTNEISKSQISDLDKIVSSVVDQYVSNMNKAVHNFIGSYIKTVKVTNNFEEVNEDSEIMMDCNKFTVIEMIDFMDIIQQVYKKGSES